MPTKHYPYMYCPRTGKGPKKRNTEKQPKDRAWSCTCKKTARRPASARTGHVFKGGPWTHCTCTSGKKTHGEFERVKNVWVALPKHRKYNQMYKHWVKQNRKRACLRPNKKDFPRQGSGLPMPKIRPSIRFQIKRLLRKRHGG